ncbi:MAG TPA: integrase core domain-containing protein, partial [Puia sp.]|nr:integrase core domain-containing protein [Puia sp.]
RVNGILKTELLQPKYESHEQSLEAIEKAISIYNKKRPHLSIGLLTPVQAHNRQGSIKKLWSKKQYPIKEQPQMQTINNAQIL